MRIFLGVLLGWASVFLGVYVFLLAGGMPVATSAPPLPLEKFLARTALHAAYRNADQLKSPLPDTEANLLAGAKLYKNDCSYCHGVPGQAEAPKVVFFPPAPQLYQHGVADDPIGETFLKVKNGIRMSAMPAFLHSYSDEQIWQVSLLLSRGKEIPATVKDLLTK